MSRLDRYVLRQLVGPFALCLGLFTVILIMQRTLRMMEMIINKGVSAGFVLSLLVWLLPSLLVLAIPMAVLLAILMTFSRMSADSEIVAMKANGISLWRMQRPVLLFGAAGWLASLAIMLFFLPYANRCAKEMIYEMASKRADIAVVPRVFCDEFKDFMIYVDEKLPDESIMRGIFVSDSSDPEVRRVMVASSGEMVSDAVGKRLFFRLYNGSVHELPRFYEDRYSVSSFETQNIPLTPLVESGKLGKKVPKGHREMTVSELRQRIRKNLDRYVTAKAAYEEARALPLSNKNSSKRIEALRRSFQYRKWLYNSSRVELQKKFSLPFACIIFALIGLPLGIASRRARQGGGLVMSLLLFLLYYVLLSTGQDLGDNGKLHPLLAMWLPNIVIGAFGALLTFYAAREKAPRLWVRFREWCVVVAERLYRAFTKPLAGERRAGVRPRFKRLPAYWIGAGRAQFPRLLDRYVAARYLKIMGLALVALGSIFMIVRFFEVLDDVMEHKSGLLPAIKYVLLSLPQLAFYILPAAVLVSTVLTLNLMSKSNELTVLLAGGTSLQRIAVAVLIIALMASGASFVLNEFIVPYSNRAAQRVWHEEINRKHRKSKFSRCKIWYRGAQRRIFNIDYVDNNPQGPVVKGLTIFEFTKSRQLSRIIRAQSAYFSGGMWHLYNVDLRQMLKEGPRASTLETMGLTLPESPADFLKSRPRPDQMSYQQLKRYIAELRRAGYSYQEYETDLMNKIAMPALSVIIALIAIPLGARARKSGRLVGMGAAIAMAGIFFVVHSSFISFGHSGKIPHFLAAWAANILFGTAGLFSFTHARS